MGARVAMSALRSGNVPCGKSPAAAAHTSLTPFAEHLSMNADEAPAKSENKPAPRRDPEYAISRAPAEGAKPVREDSSSPLLTTKRCSSAPLDITGEESEDSDEDEVEVLGEEVE